MKRNIILILLICLVGLLQAQINLSVSVIDAETLRPVKDVPVILKNSALGLRKAFVTDQRGRVTIAGLPIHDRHQLEIPEADEWFGNLVDVGEMRSNRDASVTIFLVSKTTFDMEEVVISANSITDINTIDGEVSATLKREELVQLPIEGRDITQVLYRLPNVTRATGFYPEAPNVAINGANSLFTNYLIDGMDNNERFLGGQRFAIPVGFAQNVTVLSNSFSAEFGNTANGIINVTSRSGSNDFHGQAYFITRPGQPLDASSPYAARDLSGNPVKNGFRRFQGGATVGGPLVKDRTFFLINFEHTTDQKDNLLVSPQLGVNETVRGHNYFNYLSAKVDQHWTKNWHSSLRFNLGRITIERQGGGLFGGIAFPSAANSQDRNSLAIASKNVFTADRMMSETNVQYARFRWNYNRPVEGQGSEATVVDPQEIPIAILGNPASVFDEIENTLQIQQKFTLFREKHTIKFGAEYISSWHELTSGGNPFGNYLVKLNSDQLRQVRALNKGSALDLADIPFDAEVLRYDVELRPSSFGTRQGILSFYVEDQWAISRLFTLNLGLRYDYDNLSKGGGTRGDLDNVAPRLSANLKVTPRSSIRAGYGIYYEKILYAIVSDALGQNADFEDYKRQIQYFVDQGILPADTDVDRVTYPGNLNVGLIGIPYLQGPYGPDLQVGGGGLPADERRILNPSGYQNPYAHQFSLGFQQQLGPKFLFFVDLMHNQTYNLFRLRDLNAPEAYPFTDPSQVVVRSPVEADLTRTLPIINTPNLPYAILDGDTLVGISRKVVMTETKGRSRYYAATFNLQKDRGEDKYAFRLIYTLSLLENNTEDINFRAMDANDFEAEWGPSINDRRHVINGFFYWYPWKGLSFNLAALIQSGQPINYIPDAQIWGTTDLNGDGRSFSDAYIGNSDRWPGAGRNSGRLPWAYTLDLGVQYDLPLGGSRSFRIRADVFNLLNTVNLSGYSNFANFSNQIQVGPPESPVVGRNSGPPRRFQFGAFFLF